MEFHNNRVGDFCKRIKSQQSDLAIKIPVRREIQFSKKNRRNETMKNEAPPVLFKKSNFTEEFGIKNRENRLCDK